MSEQRATAATLALCLAASQAALLVLTPILTSIAADFGVSTATAGQLRTVSGLTAGVTAVLSGLFAARAGLRDLLALGLVVLALGSVMSAVAPHFAVLAVAQVPIGMGVGLTYSAAVAAVAEWSRPEDRSRVLAVALLGPPLAWVVGMPLGGAAGEASWRLSWIVVPLVLSLAGLVALSRHSRTPPAEMAAGLRTVLEQPAVVRWSLGELLAYSAWLGVLVFIGALFVEAHGLSVAETGLVLGGAAAMYIPGNVIVRRWVDKHGRRLLVSLAFACAAMALAVFAVRTNLWVSCALFGALAFLAGGRTLAGSARGLDLAPGLRLGVTGLRTAALQFGSFVGAAVGGAALAARGFTAAGVAFAVLFAAAAIPHLRDTPPS
jgi:MFS transporter, DHA1 family, inner membrane transport protein